MGLRGEWGLVLVVVQVLTRIPVRAPHGGDGLRRAGRYLPLVGLGIGGVAASVYWVAGAGLPGVVAALLCVAATVLLTGGLHEDGLADCCDGLFGGRDRAGALRIMRDSRVGAFGVLGLGLVVGVKVGCVAVSGPVALVAGHAASRFWMVAATAGLDYAREGNEPGIAGGVVGAGWRELVVGGVFGLGPLVLLGWRGVGALVVSGVAAWGVAAWARRRVGGYTGDVLGAIQQVSEVGVLVAAAWRVG